MNHIAKAPNTLDPAIIESLVIGGDLSGLNNAQRVAYYKYRCEQVGLDPSAKPFDVLKLQGKTVLYANAGCTQQLCKIHKLSVSVTAREKIGDIYCVTVRVSSKLEDRSTENMGTVPLIYPEKYYDKNAGKMVPHPKAGQALIGDDLANAMLKTMTKAIRRTVLAHCGLGMMDETEVETIPDARPVRGGNPLRHEFAAFSTEIDGAKSQEQIDLVLGSPEFADFERRDEEQAARGGVGFAGMLRDKADAMRAKLPPTVEPSSSQQKAIEEYKNAAQSRADVAPEATSSAGEPPAHSPEFSEIAVQCMERFDLVDDADGYRAAQKFAVEHQKELTAEEKKALNELSRRVGARLREAA